MQRILLIGLMLMMVGSAAAKDGYALVCDLDDGVEVRLRGKIVSEECWAGNRNVFERVAVRAGGWKQHLYIAENLGDYVWARFVLDDGATLVLDPSTRLALVYEDESRVVSAEMIFTDSHKENEIFVTAEETVVLTSTSTRYGRSQGCNGFLVAVRFERGVLRGGGGWGYELPVRVEIMRGE